MTRELRLAPLLRLVGSVAIILGALLVVLNATNTDRSLGGYPGYHVTFVQELQKAGGDIDRVLSDGSLPNIVKNPYHNLTSLLLLLTMISELTGLPAASLMRFPFGAVLIPAAYFGMSRALKLSVPLCLLGTGFFALYVSTSQGMISGGVASWAGLVLVALIAATLLALRNPRPRHTVLVAILYVGLLAYWYTLAVTALAIVAGMAIAHAVGSRRTREDHKRTVGTQVGISVALLGSLLIATIRFKPLIWNGEYFAGVFEAGAVDVLATWIRSVLGRVIPGLAASQSEVAQIFWRSSSSWDILLARANLLFLLIVLAPFAMAPIFLLRRRVPAHQLLVAVGALLGQGAAIVAYATGGGAGPGVLPWLFPMISLALIVAMTAHMRPNARALLPACYLLIIVVMQLGQSGVMAGIAVGAIEADSPRAPPFVRYEEAAAAEAWLQRVRPADHAVEGDFRLAGAILTVSSGRGALIEAQSYRISTVTSGLTGCTEDPAIRDRLVAVHVPSALAGKPVASNVGWSNFPPIVPPDDCAILNAVRDDARVRIYSI